MDMDSKSRCRRLPASGLRADGSGHWSLTEAARPPARRSPGDRGRGSKQSSIANSRGMLRTRSGGGGGAAGQGLQPAAVGVACVDETVRGQGRNLIV
jgi:hypothetical protein